MSGTLGCPNSTLDSELSHACREWAHSVTKALGGVTFYDDGSAFEAYSAYRLASEHGVGREDRVFFAGAYHNSALQLFARLGYRRVVGMDYRREVYDEPYYWRVKYYRGDLLDTHMPPSFFKAYFAFRALDTVSYGLSRRRSFFRRWRDPHRLAGHLLREASRILRDGGLLVVTARYGDSLFFAPGCVILDRSEVEGLIKVAKDHGFELIENPDLDLRAGPLSCNNRGHGLVLMTFRLRKREVVQPLRKVNIVSPMIRQEGISLYAENLKRRFEEIGVEVNLVRDLGDRDSRYPTIFEYEKGLHWKKLLWPVLFDRSIYVELHSGFYSVRDLVSMFLELARTAVTGKWICCDKSQRSRLVEAFRQLASAVIVDIINLPFIRLGKNILVKTTDPDSRLTCCLRRFYVVPHIAYPDLGVRAKPSGLKICSFGFAARHKNFDKVCDLAIRLGVPCKLVITVNEAKKWGKELSLEIIAQLKSKYSKFSNVEIYDGFFADDEVLRLLSDCSHIVFAQDDTGGVSGSYRFPVGLGVPIIATDSFQARDAQVIRVRSLDELTVERLMAIKETVNLDDGFEYLLAVLTHRA